MKYIFVTGGVVSGLGKGICAALMGCPYERGAVLAALRSHGIDGAVYRISAEELASVVVD